jgi:Lanthionine synthetase C-like protein
MIMSSSTTAKHTPTTAAVTTDGTLTSDTVDDKIDIEALRVLLVTTKVLFWECYAFSLNGISSHSHSYHHHKNHYQPDGSWARGELGKYVLALQFVQWQQEIQAWNHGRNRSLFPEQPQDDRSPSAVFSSPTPIRDRARQQRLLEQVHTTLWEEHYPALPSKYSTRNVTLYYQRPNCQGLDGASSSSLSSLLNLYTSPTMGTYCLLIHVQHVMDQQEQQQEQNYPRYRHGSKVKRLLQEVQDHFYHLQEQHHDIKQQLNPLNTTASSITSLSLQFGSAGVVQGIFYLRELLQAPRLFSSHVVKYSVDILCHLQQLQHEQFECESFGPTTTLPLGMSKGLIGILFTLLACSQEDWKLIETKISLSPNSAGTGPCQTPPRRFLKDMIDRLWHGVERSLITNSTYNHPQSREQPQPQHPHQLLHHLHWSNGASGLVCLLLRAAQVLESKRYIEYAQRLCEHIWERHQEKRRQEERQDRNAPRHDSSKFGLANGVSGTVMSFILLARLCPIGPLRTQWEKKVDTLLHEVIRDWHAFTASSAAAGISSYPPHYGIWDGLGGLLSVLFFRFHPESQQLLQPVEFPMFPSCYGNNASSHRRPRLKPNVNEPGNNPLPSCNPISRGLQPLSASTILSSGPASSRRSMMTGKAVTTSGASAVRLTRAVQLRMELNQRPWSTSTTAAMGSDTFTHTRRKYMHSFHPSVATPSTTRNSQALSHRQSGPAEEGLIQHKSKSPVPEEKIQHESKSPSTTFDDDQKVIRLEERRIRLQAEHSAKLLRAQESRRKREEQAKLRSQHMEDERRVQLEKRKAKIQEEASARIQKARQEREKAVLLNRQKVQEQSQLRAERLAKRKGEDISARELTRNATRSQKERLERAKIIRRLLDDASKVKADGVKERHELVSAKRKSSQKKKMKVAMQLKVERQKQSDRKRQEDERRVAAVHAKILAGKLVLLQSRSNIRPDSPAVESDALQSNIFSMNLPIRHEAPTAPPVVDALIETVQTSMGRNDAASISGQHEMVRSASPPSESYISDVVVPGKGQHPHLVGDEEIESCQEVRTTENTADDVGYEKVEENEYEPREGKGEEMSTDVYVSDVDGRVNLSPPSFCVALDSSDDFVHPPCHEMAPSHNVSSVPLETPVGICENEDGIDSGECPRRTDDVNFTDDEDFESINAMFAQADSILQSQLALILGPIDASAVVAETACDTREVETARPPVVDTRIEALRPQSMMIDNVELIPGQNEMARFASPPSKSYVQDLPLEPSAEVVVTCEGRHPDLLGDKEKSQEVKNSGNAAVDVGYEMVEENVSGAQTVNMFESQSTEESSECYAAPTSARKNLNNPSFPQCTNDTRIVNQEEDDDDFARMDSLFEEAENQLKAELASILGESPERTTQEDGSASTRKQEVESDDDFLFLQSIVDEDTVLSPRQTGAESGTRGRTHEKNIVASGNYDMTLSNNTFDSFSRSGTAMRRRGNRKVAPES